MTTHPLTGRYIAGLLPLFFLFLFLSFSPTPATAACTDPVREEGAFVYNHSWGVFQGCTAEGWVRFNEPTVAGPPQGCGSVGEVCTGTHAGMIYAGEYEGNKLYVAAEDAPTTLAWGPSPSTSDMGFCNISPHTTPLSCYDGLTNTQILEDHVDDFPAAKYCANLSVHGYGVGQWYLPSLRELTAIFFNLQAVESEGVYNFKTGGYWSSTEYNTGAAWHRYITITGNSMTSYGYNPPKQHPYWVRCVAM